MLGADFDLQNGTYRITKVYEGAPWDIVGLTGNVAGAQIVAELGNRVPIRKVPLAKQIIALMK